MIKHEVVPCFNKCIQWAEENYVVLSRAYGRIIHGNHGFQNKTRNTVYKNQFSQKIKSDKNNVNYHNKYILDHLRREFSSNPKEYYSASWNHMVPVIKGSKYIFSHEPIRKDIYLYNEIFNPSEPDHLYLNYFNSWFDPDFDYVPQPREKRSLKNQYRGDVELQFTSDDIDYFINLKTNKVFKRKPRSLNEAFERVEHDLKELAKIKTNNKTKKEERNKLSIDPENGNIEVDSNMPSEVEHLDRRILEDIIQVYIPKQREKRFNPTSKSSQANQQIFNPKNTSFSM